MGGAGPDGLFEADGTDADPFAAEVVEHGLDLSGRPERVPVLVTRNSRRTWFWLPSTGPSTATVALKVLPRLEASSMVIATAVKTRMATTITIRPVGPRISRLRRPGGGGCGWVVAGELDIGAIRLAGQRALSPGPAREVGRVGPTGPGR